MVAPTEVELMINKRRLSSDSLLFHISRYYRRYSPGVLPVTARNCLLKFAVL